MKDKICSLYSPNSDDVIFQIYEIAAKLNLPVIKVKEAVQPLENLSIFTKKDVQLLFSMENQKSKTLTEISSLTKIPLSYIERISKQCKMQDKICNDKTDVSEKLSEKIEIKVLSDRDQVKTNTTTEIQEFTKNKRKSNLEKAVESLNDVEHRLSKEIVKVGKSNKKLARENELDTKIDNLKRLLIQSQTLSKSLENLIT